MGNLHYKISREKFEPEPGFEPRTSGFFSPALYHLSYPGSLIVVNIMADSAITAQPGKKKWHPSQEGDLNMSWYENQDS